MFRRARPALLSVALTAAIACSTGGKVDEVPSGSGQGGAAAAVASASASSTGAASVGAAGGDATGTVGCAPACVAPQFCSVTNECIDEGTCAADGDCDIGMECADDGTCVPGGACGGQEAVIEPIPPNLLIVLDRSCSMKEEVNAQTKWAIAVAALTELTTTYAGKIRFGLSLFPDKVDPDCQQGPTIPIPVEPNQESAIQALLAAALLDTDPYWPNGPCVTNIDTAMLQASMEPALADPARESYVLLIGDGMQAGCNSGGGDTGTIQTIGALYADGVSTFVVGFAVGADAGQLDAFAEAGGVPASGATKYYDAADAAALDAALTTIADKTLSCTFNLDSTPPDADDIFVFFEDVESIPSSDSNGWTYEESSNTIEFHGEACDRLKGGEVNDVDIVFGCNEPSPT